MKSCSTIIPKQYHKCSLEFIHGFHNVDLRQERKCCNNFKKILIFQLKGVIMSRGHLQLSLLNSERTLRYKDFLFDDNDFDYNDDDEDEVDNDSGKDN